MSCDEGFPKGPGDQRCGGGIQIADTGIEGVDRRSIEDKGACATRAPREVLDWGVARMHEGTAATDAERGKRATDGLGPAGEV